MLPAFSKRSIFAVKQLVQYPFLRSLTSGAGASKLFSKEHEWVAVSGTDGTVGISDHAQKALGDVVYVELPDVGTKLEQNDKSGAVESVKAVSDVYAPVSGTVSAVNEKLKTSPGLINNSCYKDGWLYKLTLSDKSELANLMNEEKYDEFLKNSDK